MKQPVYYTASALCGAGKSYQAAIWASEQIKREGMKIIYAVPTIELSKQPVSEFKRNGVTAEVFNSEVCKRDTTLKLKERLDEFSKSPEGGVIITTHQSLEIIATTLTDEVKSKLVLLVDEILDVVKAETLTDSTGDMGIYNCLFDYSDSSDVIPHRDYKQVVETIAAGKHPDTKFNQPSVRAVCKAAASNCIELHKVTNHTGEKKCIHFLAITSYRLIKGFSKVILMSALFESMMLFKVWKKQGVRFEEFTPVTDVLGSQEKHINIRGDVNIFYLTDKRWTGTTHTRSTAYMNEILDTLPELFGGESYLLATNEHTKLNLPSNAVKISTKSLGSNQYKNIHNIAYLAATNGIPQVIAKLKDFYGFDDGDILDVFVLPDAYQTILRTSLRTPTVNANRNILVGSKELAERLAGLIEGSMVRKLDGLEKLDGRHKSKPLTTNDRAVLARLRKKAKQGGNFKVKDLKTISRLEKEYPQCLNLSDELAAYVSPFSKVA
jgi:DEAD/DEAH box helicase